MYARFNLFDGLNHAFRNRLATSNRKNVGKISRSFRNLKPIRPIRHWKSKSNSRTYPMQDVPWRRWIPGTRPRIGRQVLFPDFALDLRFGLGITLAVIADPFGLVDDPVFVAVPFLLRPPSPHAASL